MALQPLSVRMGKRQRTGPYDGVPQHLINSLINWIRVYFYAPYGQVGNYQFLRYLALHLLVAAPPAADEKELFNLMLNLCVQDPDFCLDLLDSMLQSCPLPTDMRHELRAILVIGGSVWTLAPDEKSLVKRVDDSAVQQFESVTSPADSASAELREAWTKAYGRRPNASDAWDHAIKAAEDILIPIVCPNKAKANLGGVAGDLKAQPGRWRLLLQNDHGGVETLESMLRLLWPNPDRHGGAQRRAPEIREAQAAVQLAVTIVQWGRTGVLEKV